MLRRMALYPCARDGADRTKWITTRRREVGRGFDWGVYGELEKKNEGFYIITVHYIHAKIIKE